MQLGRLRADEEEGAQEGKWRRVRVQRVGGRGEDCEDDAEGRERLVCRGAVDEGESCGDGDLVAHSAVLGEKKGGVGEREGMERPENLS